MTKLVEFPDLGLSFNLDPVAFKIGSFEIYWYGIVIALGFVLALIYCMKNFKRFGISTTRALDVILVGIVGGVVGARVYYVIFSWDTFKGDLGSIFDIRDGGIAIYGGLIGAILVGVLMCKIRKVKVGPMLDICGIGFLIGQGIGRWGNFFNVEAFGSNTNLPWGMTGPSIVNYLSGKSGELSQIGVTVDPSMPVHPTFFYEFLWCIIGFVLLHIFSKHRKFDGEVFLLYTAWYGFGRFWIEGLRTDSLMIGNLRASQLLAGFVVIISIIIIVVKRNQIKRSGEQPVLYVDTQESKDIIEMDNDDEKSKKIKKDEIKLEKEFIPKEKIEEQLQDNIYDLEDEKGEKDSESN